MNKISVTQALEKFDSLLDNWNDLPNHVYKKKYRGKFYDWIKSLERKDSLQNYKIVEVLNNERNGEEAPFWN